MKKIFMTMVALMLMSASAWAGSELEVKQGDKKFFKTAEGNAVLEFVFDNATYDGRMPLTEKFSMSNLKKLAYSGFKQEFNDQCKKVKIVEDNSNVKYKFTVVITKMDQYFKVMGFIPGNATKAWGTITVTDANNGEVLLVVDVDEVDGGASPSPDETISDCFEEMGEQFSDLK